MKIFYFDVETGGLDCKVNPLLTLSGIIEIDGEVKETITLKIKPFKGDLLADEALKINGLTMEEIKTFDEPLIAKKKLEDLFSKYVDKYKKNKTSEDKLIPAGYNVLFDIQFLETFWKKCGDNYFGSFIDYHKLDIASIVLFLKMHKVLDFPGYKLATISQALGIIIKAHDATSDIEATREIAYKLIDKIKEIK